MSKIDRLKRITMARIEAFLDAVEKPQDILPQLVKELNQRLNDAVNAEAKALGAVKGARRRHDEATGRLLRLHRGAELAVRADDNETARQTLAAIIDAEKKADSCQKALDSAQTAYQAAHNVRTQLQHNLNELKARKNELLARAQAAQEQKEMLEKLRAAPGARADSILDLIARIETKIDTDEAEIEIQNEITGVLGLAFQDERIRELERHAEVTKRLQQLKQKLNQDPPNSTP